MAGGWEKKTRINCSPKNILILNPIQKSGSCMDNIINAKISDIIPSILYLIVFDFIMDD